MKTAANLAITIAVAGSVFTALILAEATTPGLDLGAVKFVMPTTLAFGLFALLKGRAGNRSVPVASDTRKAELLDFPPRPGCGWMVVMRDKGNIGAGVGFDVSVDDRVVAHLMAKRFTMVALPAGTHRVFVGVPNGAGDLTPVPLDITVTPGAILIFAIRASMGLVRASLRLEPVADTPGVRAALARMQLAESEG